MAENLFIQEIEEEKSKKASEIKEEFEKEKIPGEAGSRSIFSVFGIGRSPLVDILKDIDKQDVEKILTQREGMERIGLNRETFEAVGGITGLAQGTKALTLRALPYIPSVPGKILSLILYDALGATAGAQAFDLIQKNLTGDEISFWEQLEALPSDFKNSLTWATIGPMAEAATQAFRVYLSKEVIKDPKLKEAFEKSKKYLGDKLAFSIGDLADQKGPGKFINLVRSGFSQIPILGGKLKGVTAERSAELFKLVEDFSSKLGKGLDEDEISKRIFENSKKAYKTFTDIADNMAKEINQKGLKVKNNGKVIPINSFRDFIQDYVTKFEKQFPNVSKTTDPGYNDFYRFSKDLLENFPQNSKISYKTWQNIMEQLENSVKNSKDKLGTNKNTLGKSFSFLRRTLDDTVLPEQMKDLPKDQRILLEDYIQSIKDFKKFYVEGRKPFEKVVAGTIETVDDIFTPLSGKFKEEKRKYASELLSPILRRMTPEAVDDLIKLSGGGKQGKQNLGELLKYWFDDAFEASMRQVKEADTAVLDTNILMKKLGYTGPGTSSKRKAFNMLIDTLNSTLPKNERIAPEYVTDMIDMLARQGKINVPATGTFLRRSVAIGGSGGASYLTQNPIAKRLVQVIGAVPGVISTVVGVRDFSKFLTDPETLNYALKGIDSTLPNMQRKTSIIQFMRALRGELEQRTEDTEINLELRRYDPDYNPSVLEQDIEKIDNFLNSVTGTTKKVVSKIPFMNRFVSEENELDKILNQIDSYNIEAEDSNLFLDEISVAEDKIGAQEETTVRPESFISIPEVTRGQGTVIPPIQITPEIQSEIQQTIDPKVLENLKSVGLPLFENFKEGGIVDLYESKKFKKPQVVA